MFTFANNIESRKKAASLIANCLYGGGLVREALKQWPDSKDDPTLICARHALIHFDADREVYKNDSEYFNQQVEWLEQLVNTLSKGESIPQNIIDSYEEYYVIPVSLKMKFVRFIARLLYPVISFMDNFLRFLKT